MKILGEKARAAATASAFILMACSETSDAATVEYASSVASTNGDFTGSAASTLDAPDGNFIQLAFGSSIVLDFGSSIEPNSILTIFTIDDIATAFANVSISEDNISFGNLGNISDANGPLGSFELNVSTAFRYVRIEDDGTGDPQFPFAGFDVDAVGRMAAPIPLPAGLPLLASAALVLGIARRRRS